MTSAELFAAIQRDRFRQPMIGTPFYVTMHERPSRALAAEIQGLPRPKEPMWMISDPETFAQDALEFAFIQRQVS